MFIKFVIPGKNWLKKRRNLQITDLRTLVFQLSLHFGFSAMRVSWLGAAQQNIDAIYNLVVLIYMIRCSFKTF